MTCTYRVYVCTYCMFILIVCIYIQASDKRLIGFGPSIGQREVVRLNLIECESCYQSTRSTSASSSTNQHPVTSSPTLPHTSSDTTSFSTSSSTSSSSSSSSIPNIETLPGNTTSFSTSMVSSHIPNIETYFGTAPKCWNSLFIAMARLTPQSILQV